MSRSRRLVTIIGLAALATTLASTSASAQRTSFVADAPDKDTTVSKTAGLAEGNTRVFATGNAYTIPDRVLFDDVDTAAAWFAAHGKPNGSPSLAKAAPTPTSGGWAIDDRFGAPGGGLVTQHRVDDEDPSGVLLQDTGTPFDPGVGYASNETGTTPLRYVAADGLPLRFQPSSTGFTVATLARGERVFVQSDLPQIDPTNNVPFVRVETIDAAPSASGWIPLYWLYRTPADPSEGELDITVGHPLFAKRLAQVIEDFFYSDCSGSPMHPHSSFGGTPIYEGPIAPAGNECGEYPMGDALIPGSRQVLDLPLSFEQFDGDGIQVWMDFDRQFRDEGGYPVKDLAENFFGAGNDVSMVRHYSRFPQHESDDHVRIHDTDVWFGITAEPPTGVASIGADAYFNFCIELPGGVLDADPFRLDYLTATGNYLQSIDLGALAFHPFQVCATAAISDTGQLGAYVSPDVDIPPLTIQWLHASIRGIELELIEPVEINAFGSTTVGWAYGLEAMFTGILHVGAQATPWVYQEFLEGPVETMLVDLMNALTQPVASALPHPTDALDGACDQLLGSYASPSSPYYPLYLHCVESTQNASVDPIPDDLDPNDACHRPDVYARANDGVPWSSSEHDESWFVATSGEAIPVDRPMWASQCGLTARVETTLRDPFWPVAECLEGTVNEALRYDRLSTLQSDSQSECLLPTVGFLCEVYGDGEDLQALWAGGGTIPAVDDYLGFCAWHAALLEDAEPSGGPAYSVGF